MASSIKETFERDGYLVMDKCFSQEEVKVIKVEIKKVLEEVEKERGAKAAGHGVFVGLSARSEGCRKVASDPRIVEILRQIIGSPLYFLSDKVVFKSKEKDFGTPWHQDWPYWEGDHKISVWIALDDATPENGCLKMIPGSHLHGFIEHTGSDTDGNGFVHRFKNYEMDESKAVSFPVEAGTAVIFHDLLLHASYPNISGKDRWALISTYNQQGGAEYDWAVAAFKISE